MSAEGCDLLPGFLGPLDEQPAVGKKVGADAAKVAGRAELTWPLESGDEVPLEEIGACGEGDGVGNRSFQVCR